MKFLTFLWRVYLVFGAVVLAMMGSGAFLAHDYLPSLALFALSAFLAWGAIDGQEGGAA